MANVQCVVRRKQASVYQQRALGDDAADGAAPVGDE